MNRYRLKERIKMKQLFQYFYIIYFLLSPGFSIMIYPNKFIPADNPNIQYFGRWDMSDSLHPEHSWPGVYLIAKFTGTSIGVRMNDNINYYNVYIDGKFHGVFHGTKEGEHDYYIAEGLINTDHLLRFCQRNISFGVYVFSGLLLDNGANLLSPPQAPSKKIEFIGDSFTAAEGNEATQSEMDWEAKFPVTNIDKGFALIIARHYNAQYHTTCRSGIGMVCDWQGKFDISMPNYFDRTLMEREAPEWHFKKWIPDLVIICLGINDYSGLKDKDGSVSEKNSVIFRNGYSDFLNTLRNDYPGVPVLAVAANAEWIRENVKQVVKEENAGGQNNIYYSQFDYFPGGYVANGHPNLETHKKIADEIISAIDKYKIFDHN